MKRTRDRMIAKGPNDDRTNLSTERKMAIRCAGLSCLPISNITASWVCSCHHCQLFTVLPSLSASAVTIAVLLTPHALNTSK